MELVAQQGRYCYLENAVVHRQHRHYLTFDSDIRVSYSGSTTTTTTTTGTTRGHQPLVRPRRRRGRRRPHDDDDTRGHQAWGGSIPYYDTFLASQRTVPIIEISTSFFGIPVGPPRHTTTRGGRGGPRQERGQGQQEEGGAAGGFITFRANDPPSLSLYGKWI